MLAVRDRGLGGRCQGPEVVGGKMFAAAGFVTHNLHPAERSPACAVLRCVLCCAAVLARQATCRCVWVLP